MRAQSKAANPISLIYLQCRNAVVGDELKTRHEGSKTFVTARVGGAWDGCQGAPPEVTICIKETGYNSIQDQVKHCYAKMLL